MPDPVITLTTDFGEASPYVAAMKGVILANNPAARLLDLSHQIPPQDLWHADQFLALSIPYFPPEVIHVVVVDPGVGTGRSLLYVEVDGHRLLLPDNGCWSSLCRSPAREPVVRRLEPDRYPYWRLPVSATFHGRDIFAPAAAHLSLGLDPDLLGPTVSEWVRLDANPARHDPMRQEWVGEVAFVDTFGNLITNIPVRLVREWGVRPLTVRVGNLIVTQLVRTYGDAEPGTVVALASSGGAVEVAVVQGNAAQRLDARVGTPAVVRIMG